jgi:uncharacterized protein
MNTLLGPTELNERINELDVLRGFALLGILIANMAFFSSPILYLSITGIEWWTSPWDQLVESFIQFVVAGKFYTLFSFLFGLGMILFMERADIKGHCSLRLYIRRLIVLLLFGIVHAFFIWSGDILLTYAALGFLLALFRNRKPKTILIWSMVSFLIPIILLFIVVGLAGLSAALPEGKEMWIQDSQDFMDSAAVQVESSMQAYGLGSYADMMKQRRNELSLMYSNGLFTLPHVFAMFLLGVYTTKRKIIHDIPSHMPMIRRVWIWSLGLGVLSSIFVYMSEKKIDNVFPTIYDLMHLSFTFLSSSALCLFYVTSLILLLRNDRLKTILSPMASMGRMAISNYLLQSIICTMLFYSYGLGLYGKVGPALTLLMALVIYSCQMVVSRYWLNRYQIGPVEWLWRSLTYGNRQPMKKSLASIQKEYTSQEIR